MKQRICSWLKWSSDCFNITEWIKHCVILVCSMWSWLWLYTIPTLVGREVVLETLFIVETLPIWTKVVELGWVGEVKVEFTVHDVISTCLLNTNISWLAFCVHGKVHIYLNGRQDRDRSHSDLPIPLRWSSSTPAWWHWWPGRYRRKRCHQGSGSTLSSHPSPLEQLQHEEGLVWISSDFTGLQTALGLTRFNFIYKAPNHHKSPQVRPYYNAKPRCPFFLTLTAHTYTEYDDLCLLRKSEQTYAHSSVYPLRGCNRDCRHTRTSPVCSHKSRGAGRDFCPRRIHQCLKEKSDGLWVRKKCAVCALNDSQKWWPFKILNKRPNVVFNPIHNIIIYYTQSCFLVKTWRDRLTLAFPASDQFVPLLALAVVCTHLVDTAAPMTAWWIFTLVDIWREGNKNSARMWSMWWEAGALFFPRTGQGFTELFFMCS